MFADALCDLVDHVVRQIPADHEFRGGDGYRDVLAHQIVVERTGNDAGLQAVLFFHGLEEGETCEVKLEEGKILVVKLAEIRDADSEGYRELIFEINGNRRIVRIKDNDMEAAVSGTATRYADEENPLEIGANIPGNIVRVLVSAGDTVEEKQPIAVIEAMKMETNIIAKTAGTVEEIFVKEGQQVKAGEMIALLSQE